VNLKDWRVAIIKDIVSGHFICVEQNDYLKIFIGCDLGNGGRGSGLVTLNSVSTITTDYAESLKAH